MIVNTIIGTGGSMYQVNRSAIQKKINARYFDMTGSIISIAELNADAIMTGLDIINDIPELKTDAYSRQLNIIDDALKLNVITNMIHHQYAILSSGDNAIDVAISHIVTG